MVAVMLLQDGAVVGSDSRLRFQLMSEMCIVTPRLRSMLRRHGGNRIPLAGAENLTLLQRK